MNENYGKELILDLHDCNASTFTRECIDAYFIKLCDLINMERADRHWWDYDDPDEYVEAPPHLKGTSAIQFIKTSNITIHTLDVLQKVFINIFSCKDFDGNIASKFSADTFGGKIVTQLEIIRR